MHPSMLGYTSGSTSSPVATVSLAPCPDGVAAVTPATHREPLCLHWALPTAGWFQPHLREPYPSFDAPTGSCAPPSASYGLRSLIPHVCAGCREPLLVQGGSRRYLCVSVPRCLDPYPGGVVRAPTHYFLTTIRLPPVPMRSAHRETPFSDFRTGVMSELQSFTHVQASRFAATQVAPTVVSRHEAAVAFTSEQDTGRYLPVHRIY